MAYTDVKPAPGGSVVFMVEGAKWEAPNERRQYAEVRLWNKTQAEAINLPGGTKAVLEAMGLGTWDADNFLELVERPLALRLTRPAAKGQRWKIERVNGGGSAAPRPPAAASAPAPRSAPPRAGGEFIPPVKADVIADYVVALGHAVRILSGLPVQPLTELVAAGIQVTLDVNAVAFSLFKAAREARTTLPPFQGVALPPRRSGLPPVPERAYAPPDYAERPAALAEDPSDDDAEDPLPF